MKHLLVAGVLGASLTSLTACGSAMGNFTPPVQTGTPTFTVDGTFVVNYRGYADLHCVGRNGGFQAVLSCDFQRFYADHPDLLMPLHARG